MRGVTTCAQACPPQSRKSQAKVRCSAVSNHDSRRRDFSTYRPVRTRLMARALLADLFPCSPKDDGLDMDLPGSTY